MINAKLKEIKKNNFYEEQMLSAEKRLKQRGLIFDKMLKSASRPIDEIVQNNHPTVGGTVKLK